MKKDSISREEISQQILKKREVLKVAKKQLNQDFIGLESVIDKIFQNIEIWYTIPQAITRPVIINLWGMTGVGKTDLVRKLVKYIGFIDRFVEVQLDSNNNPGGIASSSYSSIQSKLVNSSIEEGETGILLLDEIQRFRTVNEQGHELVNSKFKDMWMLLSDGRFNSSGDSKVQLVERLLEDLYLKDIEKSEKRNGDDDDDDENESNTRSKQNKYKRRYHSDVWEANSLKKALKLKESVEDIMKMPQSVKLKLIADMLNNPFVYEGADYSKLLIFISGNIDEAYNMSDMTQNADIDADTLHEFSKGISVVDIKEQLKHKFKPEQIARFGNVHVIYPSFSKKDFDKIINKKIKEVVDNIEEKTSVKLDIDKSVNKTIYRNGVYPAQGVRPVFSSVGSILDSNLPRFICAAIESDQDEVKIKFVDNKLFSVIGGKEIYSDKIELDLDLIRKKIDNDHKMSVSVHEAGHAVVYSSLFKLAPTQTISSTLKHGGYVFHHNVVETKQSILNSIKVLFAGKIAESIVFGDDNVTSGCANDMTVATEFACSYVRNYGFGKYFGIVDSESKDNANETLSYIHESSGIIDKILEDQYKACYEIIENNLDFLKDLSMTLVQKGDINAEQFLEIGSKYVNGLKIKKAAENVYSGYYDMGKTFFGKV